jgi:hypothetical protein
MERMSSRATAAIMAMGTGLAGLMFSACASPAANNSTAAPPLTACGTTLYKGAAGATVIDATGPTAQVNLETTGGGIYLLLSTSCLHGATLTVPPTDATVAALAHTSDGGIALIGLHPVRGQFVLVAERAGGPSTTITVDIPGLPT